MAGIDVIRSFSPLSLYSLAFVKSLALTTSELRVLPQKKFEQIKAFKEGPGRYRLVQQSMSSRRIGHADRSEYFHSNQEFSDFVLYQRADDVITVGRKGHWNRWDLWSIGPGVDVDWDFKIDGSKTQAHAGDYFFHAEVDKDGNVNAKVYTKVSRKRSVQAFGYISDNVYLHIEITISFGEGKMDINVKGENEHFVGEFSGQYVKLD